MAPNKKDDDVVCGQHYLPSCLEPFDDINGIILDEGECCSSHEIECALKRRAPAAPWSHLSVMSYDNEQVELSAKKDNPTEPSGRAIGFALASNHEIGTGLEKDVSLLPAEHKRRETKSD